VNSLMANFSSQRQVGETLSEVAKTLDGLDAAHQAAHEAPLSVEIQIMMDRVRAARHEILTALRNLVEDTKLTNRGCPTAQPVVDGAARFVGVMTVEKVARYVIALASQGGSRNSWPDVSHLREITNRAASIVAGSCCRMETQELIFEAVNKGLRVGLRDALPSPAGSGQDGATGAFRENDETLPEVAEERSSPGLLDARLRTMLPEPLELPCWPSSCPKREGVLHWIATEGNTQRWKNPSRTLRKRSCERVPTVRHFYWSDWGGHSWEGVRIDGLPPTSGRITNVLEMSRDPKLTVWRCNPSNLWFLIDIRPWAVVPSRYELRNSPGGVASQCMLSSWRLEGSRDGQVWFCLHESTSIFDGSHAGNEMQLLRGWQIAGGHYGPLSRFRLTQTGPPYRPNTEEPAVGLSGFELFGLVMHTSHTAFEQHVNNEIIHADACCDFSDEPISPSVVDLRKVMERKGNVDNKVIAEIGIAGDSEASYRSPLHFEAVTPEHFLDNYEHRTDKK